MKKAFRIISGIMLIAAIGFLAVTLTNPQLGSVFYIGDIPIGSSVWRAFYCIYAIVTVGLFVASFFVGHCKAESR